MGTDKRKGKYGTDTKWVSAAFRESREGNYRNNATRRRNERLSGFLPYFRRCHQCVLDIAQLLGMSQSAISHQLRVLKQMDLVKNRRDGKTIFYSLADAHIVTILSQGLDHIEE